MTNTNTIPPAIARLLALGPLPSQMSARDAAEVLGGSHYLKYVLRLVEVGDLTSWTHSPIHGDQWHWKDRYGNEKILPCIATDTDPDDVVVTGEDVLWHWCVLLEEAIHGKLPPKDAVEERLAQVRSLQREYALGTLAAPTEDAPQAVPAPEDAPAAPCASPAPHRQKRPTWLDVAGGHILEVMRAGQHSTAKALFRALEERAGAGSPFDRGQGAHRGSLFAREIGQPLSLKTLQNHFSKLRAMVADTAP